MKQKPVIPLDSLMLTRKRLKVKSKQQPVLTDTVPITLSNLHHFLNWRCTAPQSPTLYKIASMIWLYLPPPSIEEYTINFQHATQNKIIQGQPASPPVLTTSSPKGELLIMVESIKKTVDMDYEDKIFLLILYPSYISNCKYFDASQVQLDNGQHCTFWEIENIENLNHLVMDKHGYIYFTDGEAIYRISKTDGNMYLDHYETIFTPSNDTSHITSLWRQKNDIFFSVQNWDNEENIDVYKLRPVNNNNNDRSRSRSRSRSTSSYSGSDNENECNEYVKKIKTFSLQFNQRIWQLGTLRFEKKFLLALGAAVMGNKPNLLEIGFHSNIKVLNMVNNKSVVFAKSLSDEIPHGIYQHKQTKSWFCIVPVLNNKNNKFYWIQYKMNSSKKKIIWQRLIPIPSDNNNNNNNDEGEWLYYDETRDVLIGYKGMDIDKNEYAFKYLPDMTKYLWIDHESDDNKSHCNDLVPIMRRVQIGPKKTKKLKLTPKNSKNKSESKKTTNTLTLSTQNGSNKSNKSNKRKKLKISPKNSGNKNKKKSNHVDDCDDDEIVTEPNIRPSLTHISGLQNVIKESNDNNHNNNDNNNKKYTQVQQDEDVMD